MISVLGSRVRWFKLCRFDGLSREIKIHSTLFFGGEVKPKTPCHKGLRRFKELRVWKRCFVDKIHHFLSRFLLICYMMSLLLELPLSTSLQHGFPYSCINWGMNNRPAGGRSADIVLLHRHDQSLSNFKEESVPCSYCSADWNKTALRIFA